MKINLQRVLDTLKVYGNNGKVIDVMFLDNSEKGGYLFIKLEYEGNKGNKAETQIKIYENNVDKEQPITGDK